MKAMLIARLQHIRSMLIEIDCQTHGLVAGPVLRAIEAVGEARGGLAASRCDQIWPPPNGANLSSAVLISEEIVELVRALRGLTGRESDAVIDPLVWHANQAAGYLASAQREEEGRNGSSGCGWCAESFGCPTLAQWGEPDPPRCLRRARSYTKAVRTEAQR